MIQHYKPKEEFNKETIPMSHLLLKKQTPKVFLKKEKYVKK